MSTPATVALNVLNVVMGGSLPMGKHSAPEPRPRRTQRVTRVNDRYYKVDAPKCPHGHFITYAVKNCKKGCAK